jgi:hypothetical protein
MTAVMSPRAEDQAEVPDMKQEYLAAKADKVPALIATADASRGLSYTFSPAARTKRYQR